MRRRLPLPLSVVGVLFLSGCAGVEPLRTGDEASLAGHAEDIRAKADEAKAKGRYADAWNLEAQAGTDRARLESIALAALAADSGPYDDMLAALRVRFGGLSDPGRARVEEVAAGQEAAGRFEDAAATHLAAADDAPAYARAWDVYRRAPVDDALAILRAIERAIERAGERARERAPDPGAGSAASGPDK